MKQEPEFDIGVLICVFIFIGVMLVGLWLFKDYYTGFLA